MKLDPDGTAASATVGTTLTTSTPATPDEARAIARAGAELKIPEDKAPAALSATDGDDRVTTTSMFTLAASTVTETSDTDTPKLDTCDATNVLIWALFPEVISDTSPAAMKLDRATQ